MPISPRFALLLILQRDLLEKLDDRAAALGVSRAALIRRYLNEGIQRETTNG